MLKTRATLPILLVAFLVQTLYLVHLYSEYSKLRVENEAVRDEYGKLVSKLQELENTYNELSKEYENLKTSYENLKLELQRLEPEKALLTHLYEQVLRDYEYLDQKYRSLLAEYAALKENYTQLLTMYNHLENLALLLNTSLSSISSTLQQMCCVPEAFTRVLTFDRVRAVGKYVLSAGVSAEDPWASIQAIYSWIRSNVRYVHDVPIPAPRSKTCDDSTNLCYYEYAEAWNYVQDPELTVLLGQGDCDDQAVLAYAMVKYYLLYIHGKDYRVWIALVQLGDGVWHMALFIPVAGGKLTIVDPAGSYLTATWYGAITAKPAREELARYSNYWLEYGGIHYIELYKVDLYTGSYELVASGGLETIASFVASLTS